MENWQKLLQAGQVKGAIQALAEAVEREPANHQLRYNFALVLLNSGNMEAGAAQIDVILAAVPGFLPAQFTKARLLERQGAVKEAEAIYRALAERPGPMVGEVWLALGNLLRVQRRGDEAVQAFRRLVEVQPANPAGYVNLAQLLLPAEPETVPPLVRQGLARMPDVAILHALLGQSLLRAGQPEAAIPALQQALKLDPALLPPRGHLLRACRETANWQEEAEVFADLRGRARQGAEGLAINLQTALNFPFGPAELKDIAIHEARFRAAGLRPVPMPPPPARDGGPLVIGYLSPDYRDHAIAHLVTEVLAAHDRRRVRVVAFSEGPPDGSKVEAEVRRSVDAFIDLRGMSDGDAARRIAAEGVHVLVDLSLYTRHHRPGIAALRPAPIQVAWLGLPTTSGAPWFDYVLVDEVVAPASHGDRFTEQLVWLPHGYQPNGRWEALAPSSRRQAGLPEDATVFACFNGHQKIDRESFQAWMRVLARVPGSVLWLLSSNETVENAYRRAAAQAGIGPERLIFAPRQARQQHLARLGLADLFLDTFVYGAHTTCSDALRALVPVVTVLGECFAARVGASLLTHLGLADLIASSVEQFERMAVELACDAQRREKVRARLGQALPNSPVYDPQRFARALEWAYDKMWDIRLAGGKPSSFPVPSP